MMKTIIDKADSRGHSLYSWLNSYHTFSFDEYYNPKRMNFGALRVLNDDTVAPGAGFGKHPHKNMEIVSIPLYGYLRHGDSEDNDRTITVGDIQTMSAGTGIYHSEMNGSSEQEVKFLQIWIIPDAQNLKPSYKDYDIRPLLEKNKLNLIISPDGETPASLHQQTWFYMGEIEENRLLKHTFHGTDFGVYIFVIEGEIRIDDTVLFTRDGIGITDIDMIEIETLQHSRLLLMEVPI